jgi:hypothetical protein
MGYEFEQTRLWQRTLGTRERDPQQHARERLRAALLKMRSNAAHLVKFIPEDCKGLTVHDVSHLDALWEMADIISGDNFEFTPVDAFVFGAAVLIHDAGMSVASYPKGIPDLINTTEWHDIAAATLRRAGERRITLDMLENPPERFRPEILFSVLRALHAKHAEELVSTSWKVPGGGEVRLLEDLELSAAFGQSIGRIAYSHHWDIERVANELRGRTGSAADLPSSWTLHEIKVACLLRCADAAHIDHRRAPLMLYALTHPRGISQEHWNFQNKLKKPTSSGDRLVYTAASDFQIGEATSWWLCFDAIRMIDTEISSAHALLEDLGEPPFAVRRVFGAESPRMLARQIGCTGWLPVDAEIRVSDPVNLARTIGGRNLYGAGPLPPLRELLQNAADAVRARRTFEGRDPLWGKIRLIIEKSVRDTWVHVDDNGIGMSERVLVGPLLDFGKSLWNSAQLREEFPGLEGKGINPIGKFGIGFFSVFNLGQHVKVISRKCTAGSADTRVLEFSSITSRPILRPAKTGELPQDFSTRISVKLDDPCAFSEGERPDWRYSVTGERPRSFSQRVRLLILALDIEVEFIDENGTAHLHKPEWLSSGAREFLEILAAHEQNPNTTIEAYEHLIQTLTDADGRSYGRAAISLLSRDLALSHVSVGGFVSEQGFPRSFPVPYVGVISGDTEEVSRRAARVDIPQSVIAAWATRQASLIDRTRFQIRDQMRACFLIVSAGGDPDDLPFCLLGKNFVSYATCRQKLENAPSADVLLIHSYGNSFQIVGIQDLPVPHLLSEIADNVLVITEGENTRLCSDHVGRRILDENGTPLSIEELNRNEKIDMFWKLCQELWGKEPKLEVRHREIVVSNYFQQSARRWVLSLKKG